MNNIIARLLWGATIALLIILLLILLGAIINSSNRYKEQLNNVKRQGQRAAQLGIDPAANPYRLDHDMGYAWLEAYLQEKEKDLEKDLKRNK